MAGENGGSGNRGKFGLIIGLILLPFLLCGGCLLGGIMIIGTGVMQVTSSSIVYRNALDTVQASEEVGELLGAPIQHDPFTFTGSMNVKNSSGKADFGFPIRGPKGAGQVSVVASKARGGEWTYERVQVTVESEEAEIDVTEIANQNIQASDD